MFRAIASDNFPPFDKFQLEFHPVEGKPSELGEVHLFTGVNGTGKTRMLSLLSAILGEPSHLVRRLKGNKSTVGLFITATLPVPANRDQWSLFNAGESGTGWQRDIHSCQSTFLGLPAFAYSGNAYVSDAPITVMGELAKPDRNFCLAFNRPEKTSQILLQAISNLKVQAAMDYMDSSSSDKADAGRAVRITKALETTLTDITGMNFVFKMENYPKPTIGVIWGSAKLSFDVLPDGLRSIIGWLVHSLAMMDVWLQGKGSPMETKAVFLLDEIESHLHPAWQRRILPAFQKLFPKAQIFVTTHSPFVIASLNHGWIHPLTFGNDGKVKNEKPIAASSGDSYVTVLEEIMGVKEWYDPETEKLLADFRSARDSAYHGDAASQTKARQIAMQVGQRSTELEYMMGRELMQMDRQLEKLAKSK